MSDSDILRKLADSATEMSDHMSTEQMRLYVELMQKKFELREAEDRFREAANIEDDADVITSGILGNVREILTDLTLRLSGSETVLLACYTKLLEGDGELDTKRLNLYLQSFKRKPANATKIIDQLSRKKWMESQSEAMHSHKTFQLTPQGQAQAEALVNELKASSTGRDRLAVVD